VLIERDAQWGAKAVVKRLYLVDLNVKDTDGALRKTLLVDLLQISDPKNIGGGASGAPAGRFTMPFDSIESVEVVDAYTLAVAIDTNYPTEDGRRAGQPDDTEMVTLRFDQALFDRSKP
jgi:glycerophosphoryl diester phosphodiesterase